jgi:hypothetical protein
LVLIDKYVRISAFLGSGRIVPQIPIELRDDLADEHALMEPEPRDKFLLKLPIVCRLSVSRLFVLKARPSGFIRTDALRPDALRPEPVCKIV